MARLSWLWKGHLFLFDRVASPPVYSRATGDQMLVAVFGLEAARWATTLLRFPAPSLWIEIPLLLALALLLVRWCGVTSREIGFRPWHEWNRTETSYFVQVVLIANIVFPLILADRLRAMVFVPYLGFGFYQELLYRGLLQTELTRRWGPLAGILASNVLYTFGPLHAVYFASARADALPMFAGIFAIGLLFGVVFRRSGNLWIVAFMHAIGNAYIVGSQ